MDFFAGERRVANAPTRKKEKAKERMGESVQQSQQLERCKRASIRDTAPLRFVYFFEESARAARGGRACE